MMEYKVYKWSDVLTIINGRNQNAVECEDGEYPIYGSGGVMGKANDYLCPPNCTIIGRKGNINKPIYVETKFWNVDTAFGLSANEEILNPRYLYYFCVDYNFERHNKAVTIPSLTKADLLKIEMCLPPLDKQKSIVGELDKINELIRIKKEQLSDYDNLAQSIFNKMFGNPVENEKGWEVKKLGEVCLIERGGSPRPIKDYITEEEDGLNWIKIGDAQEGSIFINSTKEKIRKEGLKKTRMVHKGDFILSNSMSFGRPYIMGVDGCIHDGWLVLHDTNNTFNKLYLYYSLAHKSMYQQFKQMAVGGVVNNLNSEMVRRVLVLVPPLTVQQEFANRIELVEMQKKQIISTIQDLETLLASRMQYWFD